VANVALLLRSIGSSLGVRFFVVRVTATATGQIQLEWLLQMHWATLAIKLAKTPRCEQNGTRAEQSRAAKWQLLPLGMCVIALVRR